MATKSKQSKLAELDQEAEAAKQAFLDAILALPPHEVTWAFSMLAETAKERIEERELKALLHRQYDRPKEAEAALERIPFYQKLIALRDLWRNAEIQHSAPAIVAAVMGRKI